MNNIAIINYSSGKGGSEINALKYCDLLVDREFVWVSLNQNNRSLEREIKAKKNLVEYNILGINKIYSFRGLTKTYKLHKMLKKRKVKYLYSIGYKPSLLACVLKIIHPSYYQISTRREIMPWRKYYHTPFLLLINYITNIMETNALHIKQLIERELFLKNKISYIPNIVPSNIYNEKGKYTYPSSLLKAKHIVGIVANVRKPKNIPLFLDIAQEVIKKNNKITFVIAGRDENKVVETYIKKHNLSQNLYIVENLSIRNISSFYQMIDIFLLTSTHEGSPNVAYEAMANSKPIISSSINAMKELVEENKNGYLCSLENIQDFVTKIMFLISDKTLRIKMGKQSKKLFIEKFDPINIKSKVLKQFKESI